MAKGAGTGGEQQRRKPNKRDDGPSGEGTAGGQVVKKAEAAKEEVDDLLAEIDEVLEENAEEFVRSYVQKGGE